MKRSKTETFPLIIKKGHNHVKIYEGENRGKPLYTLSYLTASGRKRENFSDLDAAKRTAHSRVATLAQGDMEALRLTGRERQLYVAASEAVAPTGISLDIAARTFRTAFDVLGHDAIIEAVKFYKRHTDTALPDITVTEAVAKFTEAKIGEGMSALYLKDVRLYLGRLAHAFQTFIKNVSADDLQGYVQRMDVGPVTRNNHRRVIVALFNFAKAQGWLDKSESTAADALGTAKVKDREVEIYAPGELAAMLSASDADFLPWLLLIAFGGIRREELAKGLQWEALNFETKTILVPANIAKTGRKRKIDMPENLAEWLQPYAGRTGAIFTIDPRKRMEKVTGATGIAWKKNALRHSFGSYMMEQTRNAGAVALAMGNSPGVVMRHYHEIVTAKDAQAYWNIRPADASKVIPMGRQAGAQ